MKYYSDFESNKTYNYKTLSLDGTKVVQEVNIKYLFAFSSNTLNQVFETYLRSPFVSYNNRNNITFPQNKMKKLNDKNCRYILCEKEVISYDINGVEFDRVTSFYQYDKIMDDFNFKKGKKIVVKNQEPRTRTFYVTTKEDKLGNKKQVLTPGGIHYNVVPGTIGYSLTALGFVKEVEVKMTDSVDVI